MKAARSCHDASSPRRQPGRLDGAGGRRRGECHSAAFAQVSTALLAFGSAITVSNAEHLRELDLTDVNLLARAVGPLKDKGKAVIGQATAGAQVLPELAARIAG